MRVLDRLARAEVSGDLKHHPHNCDVDVLGAAGMAAVSGAHLALFRLKYLSDATEIAIAKTLFVRWTRAAMIKRGVDPAGASRLGTQALTAWLDDVCKPCGGHGRKKVPGAPMLSDRMCPCCGGSGRNRIAHSGAARESVRDVMERADCAVQKVRALIEKKVGK